MTALTVAALTAQVVASGPPAELPPLAPHERAILSAMVEDEPPKVLLNIRKESYNEHYLAGNEEHMDLFYAPLKDLGGVYAGVGTDQAYFFIGWMKARFAFLTDYDPWVQHLHRVYAVLFDKAETPDRFRVMWSRRKRSETLKVLRDAGLPRGTINIFKWGRYLVARRLLVQQRYFRRKHPNIPTFLTDQGTYDHVRTMIMQGRVRPMIGNLLDTRGLRSVAHFCRWTGQPLRAFYISNAEQYWPRYTDAFRDNILAQMVDERSLLVRTVASQAQNGGFRYVVQPFDNFKRYMPLKWVRRVHVVVPRTQFRRGEFRLERLDIAPEKRRSQYQLELAQRQQASGK